MNINLIKEYLIKRMKKMKKHKPKSYTNKIRYHECKYLLNYIEKLPLENFNGNIPIEVNISKEKMANLLFDSLESIHDTVSKD